MNVGGGGPPYPNQPPPPYGPAPGIHATAPHPQMTYNFPPPQPPPTTTVTLIQVPALTRLGPESACITCPSCQATVSTRVTHEASSRTHTAALIMCIFGLWPCCLIPYCMDSCQNSMHYCPACGAFLGSYQN